MCVHEQPAASVLWSRLPGYKKKFPHNRKHTLLGAGAATGSLLIESCRGDPARKWKCNRGDLSDSSSKIFSAKTDTSMFDILHNSIIYSTHTMYYSIMGASDWKRILCPPTITAAWPQDQDQTQANKKQKHRKSRFGVKRPYVGHPAGHRTPCSKDQPPGDQTEQQPDWAAALQAVSGPGSLQLSTNHFTPHPQPSAHPRPSQCRRCAG